MNRGGKLRGEDGVALTEFALVLPVVLVLVFGVISFGKALTYWLDLTRIANEGARWAAVNQYPGCPLTDAPGACTPTLQSYLASRITSDELRTGGSQEVPDGATVRICTPPDSSVGDPVTVTVETTYNWLPFVNAGGITLAGSSTMRLEHSPTHIAFDSC